VLLVLAACLVPWLAPAEARGQAIPTAGRFSLFYDWAERETEDGVTTDFGQLIGTLTLHPIRDSGSLFEYALDIRYATYPGTEGRDDRVSIYDAWLGLRTSNDRFSLRVGQMWLHELGGLASIAGAHAELRLTPSTMGRFRLGLFGGLEPKILDAGYVEDITKGGVYVALDGDHGRRHILGWVLIHNDQLTERSVVVLNNFIPVARKFFVYQAMQYEIAGADGLLDSRLSYFFVNLRYRVTPTLDLQGTYHYGRSINARSITEDILLGRPIEPGSLDGLLFESGLIRVMFRPWKIVRLWAGYGKNRNNRGDAWYDRTQAGMSLVDPFGWGTSLTASLSKIDRESGNYDSKYISLSQSIGRSVWLSLDYITSLSVYRYRQSDGGYLLVTPESERWALSATINFNRTVSLLLSAEVMDHDDFDELRALTGLTVRF
jgi:hypothetical protein